MNRIQQKHFDASQGPVRKAEERDLPRVVEIHQQAFQNFFLTHLGRGFLQKYYEMALKYPAGVLLVSEAPSGVEGFVCGFVDPQGFYKLMSRSRLLFIWPILWALIRHPSVVARVIYNIRRVDKERERTSAGSCELSSVAVRPDAAG